MRSSSTEIGELMPGSSATPANPHALPTEFTPDWAVPPGEIIQAELKARGITQTQLAMRTSLSPKHVNQLIKGIVNLSPDVALALERTLDIPADFWLRTEANWRAIQTRSHSRTSLAGFADWFARFPSDVLLKRHIIKRSDDIATRIDRLLRLFRVTDTTAFDNVWLMHQANFKRSQRYDVDPYATVLWIRLAEMAAEDKATSIQQYDARRLRDLLPTLRRLTSEKVPKAFTDARTLLAEAGVILVYMPEIKNTRICGASRWLPTGQPFIALTNRNKYLDSFWFYFAHEIGHVLLHPKRATYIDLLGKRADDDKDLEETVADKFAEELLIPQSARERFAKISTLDDLKALAADLDVATEVVAGQYGHATDKWHVVSSLRRRVNLDAVLDGI